MEDKELQDLGNEAWDIATFANNINMMIVNEKAYKDLINFYARMRAEKFVALMKNGFKVEEALNIITNTSIFG